MKNIGIILAGGSGSRVGAKIAKQFITIEGKTILEHTIEKFVYHPLIDELAVVISEKEYENAKYIISRNNYSKKILLTIGGEMRYHSTLAALKLYTNERCNILIHDAARPLVTHRIITDVITALKDFHAVNVAIPATDTIIETDHTHNYIERIPNRHQVFLVQTPQGFDSQTLENAYKTALSDPEFITTDDCSVVKRYLPEEKIKIVEGDTSNIKLTYAEDIAWFEHMLKNN